MWDPKRPPKPDEAKPNMPVVVPIPIDFGPVPGCSNHDPKLLNCEIAQPNWVNLSIPGFPGT